MTRKQVIRTIKEHGAELGSFGVSRLAVFGSVARDDDDPGSDVDVLVAFDRPTTIDLYFNLKFWLEDLLGRPVDLVTEKALRPEMADEVRREAVHVAP
jgi:hypothetical protein